MFSHLRKSLKKDEREIIVLEAIVDSISLDNLFIEKIDIVFFDSNEALPSVDCKISVKSSLRISLIKER